MENNNEINKKNQSVLVFQQDKITNKTKDKYYCYILKNNSATDNFRTYNGSTNDLSRRLRQHNQEISGGARYTKKYGDKSWEICAYVAGFPNRKNALQCEWRIAHPDNKRRRGPKYNKPDGRIIGLNEVLKLKKWTNNSIEDNSTMDLQVYVYQEYVHLLTDLPNNVKINILENKSYVIQKIDNQTN